jgi:hypothetical protein
MGAVEEAAKQLSNEPPREGEPLPTWAGHPEWAEHVASLASEMETRRADPQRAGPARADELLAHS